MITSSHPPAPNDDTGIAPTGDSEASFVSELRTCNPSKDAGKVVSQLSETPVYIPITHLF